MIILFLSGQLLILCYDQNQPISILSINWVKVKCYYCLIDAFVTYYCVGNFTKIFKAEFKVSSLISDRDYMMILVYYNTSLVSSYMLLRQSRNLR
jgi:hypothetical protein